MQPKLKTGLDVELGLEVSIDGEPDDDADEKDAVVDGYVWLVEGFFCDSVYGCE